MQLRRLLDFLLGLFAQEREQPQSGRVRTERQFGARPPFARAALEFEAGEASFEPAPEKYAGQIARIRAKLLQAAQVDERLQLFGASSHGYRIGPPLAESVVAEYEQRYELSLPPCYRAFLRYVGHGPVGPYKCGAGPFYGLSPLRTVCSTWSSASSRALNQALIIHPGMSDQEFASLCRTERKPASSTNESSWSPLAGLVMVGEQGCTFETALVATGEHRGRVVNVCTDRSVAPKFAYEANFLDWYERWLDEVISRKLFQGNISWFGYCKGGSEQVLLVEAAAAEDAASLAEVIAGIGELPLVSEQGKQLLRSACDHLSAEVRREALLALTKHDYERAASVIRSRIESEESEFLSALKALLWFAKDRAGDWATAIVARISGIEKIETLRFATYVLEAARAPCGVEMRPFCSNADDEIRQHAIYVLGNQANKSEHIDWFLRGLEDSSPHVVRTTLQALAGVRDSRLNAAYKAVAKRFRTDEHYVRTNLQHRLREPH